MSIPKEVTDFLTEFPVFYLATIRNGIPKNRPFSGFRIHNDKLWFITSNNKDVYRDLQANSNFEIAVTGKNMQWLRLMGKAVFENNPVVKASFLDGFLKEIYTSPENPILEVFYIENAIAQFCSHSEPVTIKF